MGNKDLYHVVTPSPAPGHVVIGGRLHWVPARTYQVISLRATGARHAAGARFGAVVYERREVPEAWLTPGAWRAPRDWKGSYAPY